MCQISVLLHEPFSRWPSLDTVHTLVFPWNDHCLRVTSAPPLPMTPSHFPVQTLVGLSRGPLLPTSLQAKGKLDSCTAFTPNARSSCGLLRASTQSPAPGMQAICPTTFLLEPEKRFQLCALRTASVTASSPCLPAFPAALLSAPQMCQDDNGLNT